MNKQDLEKVIVIDTETTGLHRKDEILQLSIINGLGKVLLNEFYKPRHKRFWKRAMAVNGITPKSTQDKEPMSDSFEKITKILNNAEVVVGYNTPFDLNMLKHNGIKLRKDIKVHDVMTTFMKIKNVRKENGHLKRFKLADCAEHYGFKVEPTEHLHDSLTDVKATLHCYLSIDPKLFA